MERKREMLGGFFSWWYEQLVSILPTSLTHEPGADRVIFVQVVEHDHGVPVLEVSRGTGEAAEFLGRVTMDLEGRLRFRQILSGLGRNRRAVLRLEKDAILIKDLVLPLASERELMRVAAYEMDRETPFTPDEVFWAVKVVARDRVQGRLHARLGLVPRARVENVQNLFEQVGLSLVGIERRTGNGDLMRIPLGGKATMSPGTGFAKGLAYACAVLAVVAVVLPFARQQFVLADLERQINDLKPAMDEIEGLKGSGSEKFGAIESEATRAGDALVTLANLTAAIPDHTYLTELGMTGGKVTISGRSGGSTDLLGKLAAQAAFHDVAFAAPVARTGEDNLETFTITFKSVP